MFTNAARSAMLDALDMGYLAAHSGFPGHAGANELSGGVYAREASTFAASAGTPPTRSLSSPVLVDVPGGSTVRWVSVWDAASGGDCLAVSPNGGDPKEFEVDASGDTVLDPDNTVSDDDKVVFYNGTPPAPLVEGTVYFVVNRTAAGFQVAATEGGSAINLTALPSGSVVYSEIVEEAFGDDGQLNVVTFVAGLNF